jgi:hypothetical protein
VGRQDYDHVTGPHGEVDARKGGSVEHDAIIGLNCRDFRIGVAGDKRFIAARNASNGARRPSASPKDLEPLTATLEVRSAGTCTTESATAAGKSSV